MFLPLYARYRFTKWRYREVRGYSWPEVRAAGRGGQLRERESGREGWGLSLPGTKKKRAPSLTLSLSLASSPQIDAAWNRRHEWGAVRVHDMLLKLSGYYVKSAQVRGGEREKRRVETACARLPGVHFFSHFFSLS